MIPSVSVLQLVKRQDADNTDVNSVDLMSLPIELQYEGWQQATPQQQGQPSVDDVITLLMNAGDDNALAAALQSIDTKVKEVQWAQDPLNPIGVWLRSRLSTETNARQAFILAARRSPALRVTDPLAYDSILQQYQLGITRAPTWENVLASTIGGSAVSAHGGLVSYTVAGDAHARVAQVSLTGSATYLETWLGVKSSRYGVNPNNFVSVWNLSNNGYTTPDTTNVADATALNGTKRVCTFATTTTMDYRAVVPVSAITANITDQRGRYIIVLRARQEVGAIGLACNVRVGYGYLFNGTTVVSFAFKPRQPIGYTSGKWNDYTLGAISIPATAGFFDQGFGSSAIGIQAEKTAGSGNLELDSIFLVPAEHCIHALASTVGFQAGVPTYLLTRPDGKIFAITVGATGTTVVEAPRVDSTAWSIPAGSGKIVVVGSNSGLDVIPAATITPTFSVYPAYSSLRGAA